MNKSCAAHGVSTALIENDVDFYRLSNKDHAGKCYAQDMVIDFPLSEGCCDAGACCSDSQASTPQLDNKTCTVLVEITNICNLECRVCYADARGSQIMPFETFKTYIRNLIDKKHTIDSIQLTGGEASMHPQFWEMLAWLYEQEAVTKIYLPTNGIEFSKNNTAEKLKPYRDKLLVLLQFDGHEAATNQLFRRSKSMQLKYRLIKKLHRYNVPMQLTMALAHNISEKEIASVVRLGMKYNSIRVIGMLPVFYTGRYDMAMNPRQRLTLSDVIHGIVDGLGKLTRESDFHTIPCSHPNCGWTTLFARRFGLITNIARYIDLEGSMDVTANKTLLSETEMRSIMGTRHHSGWKKILHKLGRKLVRSQDVFGIAIKPFMDVYTYDQDRVSACCHHILDTKGQLKSFCEYNVLERESDDWSAFKTI
jgi:uncharacterized radical SAM superfamily Fe-S cluster-containing enzyme